MLHSFRLNERSIDLQKECFVQFLCNELTDTRLEIEKQLEERHIVCIAAPEAYGLSHYVSSFAPHEDDINQEKTFYIKATSIINDAHKLALIILKEAGCKLGNDLLQQLKKQCGREKYLIVIDQISHLSLAELRLLLDSLQNAKVILLASSKSSFKGLNESSEERVISVPAMTDERAVELGMALLSYRSDLILTSANRKELLQLVNACENLPEIIYMALAGSQSEKNLAISKYVQLIQKQKLKFPCPQHYLLLNYLFAQLPREALDLLRITYYLPPSGFTANDLIVLCKHSFSSSEQIVSLLKFLSYTFSLKVNSVNLEDGVKVSTDQAPQLYALPEFLRKFIKSNLLQDSENNKIPTSDFVNLALLQRLESDSLWKKPHIWISQLEQSFITLNWIKNEKLFDDNQYLALFVQSMWIDFGLYKYVEDFFVSFCQDAINFSNNNESRGFWYSLLGLTYKAIAKFKDSNKNCELSLLALNKSLKFYNPQKHFKRYSYVHQNIGSLHQELASQKKNDPVHLKEAIKSFLKALSENKDKVAMNVANLKRLIAQCHLQLGLTENKAENFQKAFNFYLQVLDLLISNQGSQAKVRVIYSELEKLKKNIVLVLEKGAQNDEIKLVTLQKQIDQIIQQDGGHYYANSKKSGSAKAV